MDYNVVDMLNTFVGYRMNSVIFIEDYVQFRFQGTDEDRVISAYLSPTVTAKDRTMKNGDPDWHDGLCSLIGLVISSIHFSDLLLNITFDGGQCLQIPKKESDETAVEGGEIHAGMNTPIIIVF